MFCVFLEMTRIQQTHSSSEVRGHPLLDVILPSESLLGSNNTYTSHHITSHHITYTYTSHCNNIDSFLFSFRAPCLFFIPSCYKNNPTVSFLCAACRRLLLFCLFLLTVPSFRVCFRQFFCDALDYNMCIAQYTRCDAE